VDDTTAQEQVARVEALLEEVETLADPAGRAKATEVAQALLELYGEGLERIVAVLAERDEDGGLAETLAEDELVSHLLLLHDLHPVPVEVRVRGALEGVRPYLESHGGNVELVGIANGVVSLRLEGSCSGCPSSTMTLKLAIEEAIRKAAPEIEEIEAEGVAEYEHVPAAGPGLIQLGVQEELVADSGSGLIQLEVSPALRPEPVAPQPAWVMAGGVPEVPGGGPVLKTVSGESLLFVRLEGSIYAYRPACAECGESLEDAALSGAELVCPECERRYDVRRAGRSSDPGLHLDPVPLLIDGSGLVKVALGSVATA